MNNLDDPATYAIDASGMFAHIESLGSELVAAWRAAECIELPRTLAPTSIVVAAMGGSAAAGDYFSAAAAGHSPIPVTIVRQYELPAHVDSRTLVVVVSYSGNTEEALACYDRALALRAPVIAITSGGGLLRKAGLDGMPVHRITYQSPPRAALAHTLAPLLRIGQKLALLPICDADVQRAADAHRQLICEVGVAAPSASNPAKELAIECAGKFAALFSAGHLDAAVRRTKNQLAENAKVLAAWEALPEATHNLVVGFEAHAASAPMTPISFESPLLHERTRRRFEVLSRLAADVGMPLRRIETSGASVLADLLEATAWGDCLSGYLALLQGVDPTRTRSLEQVRRAMALEPAVS